MWGLCSSLLGGRRRVCQDLPVSKRTHANFFIIVLFLGTLMVLVVLSEVVEVGGVEATDVGTVPSALEPRDRLASIVVALGHSAVTCSASAFDGQDLGCFYREFRGGIRAFRR